MSSIVEDVRANRGHPKEQMILISLRLAQSVTNIPVVGLLARLAHRFWTEMIYGIELRPETKIGPGLKIFHGYGTVVNTGTIIGSRVKIHHGVTLGARKTGEASPTILDGSEIGAGAIILGGVRIGPNALIGAGAVVLSDVPENHIAVGNPARIISRRHHSENKEID